MLWYGRWIQIVHSSLQKEFQREYEGKEREQRTLYKVEWKFKPSDWNGPPRAMNEWMNKDPWLSETCELKRLRKLWKFQKIKATQTVYKGTRNQIGIRYIIWWHLVLEESAETPTKVWV